MPSAAMREHFFTFPDEMRALLFVRRLTLTLSHLAVFRDGARVKVLDGNDEGAGNEIARLAKMSGFVPASP